MDPAGSAHPQGWRCQEMGAEQHLRAGEALLDPFIS